jgi:L-ascorbate metabolism protein UlaG (beta-lactamase superfamily)
MHRPYSILFLLVLFSACKTLHVPTYKGDPSDHFDGKHFFNPEPFEMGKFKDIRAYYKTNKRAKWIKEEFALGENVNRRLFAPASEVYYTHINHSTVLIQMDSINILTDPIFSKRASPFYFAGPKRYREPGIQLDSLPPIHYILISHDHYDHLDIPSLKKLANRWDPKILGGLGLKGFLKKFNLDNVNEMDWDHFFLDPTTTIKFHFLPAVHWSNRFIQPNKTLWGSFVIEGNATVYFAGDTAYGDHFENAKERFNKINLALIPIGAYIPRDFMRHVHMAPEDAFRCFQDLEAEVALGIHWGTFQLTGEGMYDPKIELDSILLSNGYPDSNQAPFICDTIPGILHQYKID